ncbi:hypothetical protein BVRB_024260, partial [Beta vulgaris subsp. vulgaris]
MRACRTLMFVNCPKEFMTLVII